MNRIRHGYQGPDDWIQKMATFGAPKMLWGQYRERYSFGKLTTTRHRGITCDDKARQYNS